ncbi:hypothetical protein [Streptomyces luteocolor]|uniref:hypothetical protein n=1 Tax=Streptomyces luteocolor TaxID=285500 RepID=UPI0013010585|nr:hypothetical protein [Streptomyces luteocolor]
MAGDSKNDEWERHAEEHNREEGVVANFFGFGKGGEICARCYRAAYGCNPPPKREWW